MTSDSRLFWFPKTKLLPPQVGQDILPRPRLVEALQTAVSQKRLTLLSAAAGSGKTTAAAALLQTEPRLTASWMSLDASDDDPASFLLLLIAALQKIDSDCGQTVNEVLQTSYADHNWLRLVGVVINDLLTAVTHPFLLVLDDLHCVSDPAIHQMLDYLLERLPPMMHILVITRHDPPLKLSRLRARGQLAEFRLETLRFSPAEMETLFNDVMQLALNDDELSLLHQRTEGWVAGVRLLTLSLPQLKSAEKRTTLIQHLAKSHRLLFDYLVDEVLTHLPAEQRDFLLKTSILTELTPELCQTVTLKGETAVILQTLYRQNLFMLLNDTDRDADDPLAEPTYRYHALFAQFLQKQLRQQPAINIAELHLRAANAEPIPERRINHFFAAEAWDKAAELIIDIGKLQSEHQFIRSQTIEWLKQIPANIRQHYYWLDLIEASALFQRGQLTQAWQICKAVLPSAQANGDAMGELEALWILTSAVTEQPEPEWSHRFAKLSAAQPELLSPVRRASFEISKAWAEIYLGNWPQAQQHFYDYLHMVHMAKDVQTSFISSQNIGPQWLFVDNGMTLIRQFDQVTLQRFGHEDGLVQAGTYARQGWTALLQGDLTTAEELGRRARHIFRLLGDFAWIDLVVDWALLIVMLARADLAHLEAYVQAAEPRLQRVETHRDNLYFCWFALWRAYWFQDRWQEASLVMDKIVSTLDEFTLALSPIVSIMEGWRAYANKQLNLAEEKLVKAARMHHQYRWIGTWGNAGIDLALFYLLINRPQDALGVWREAAAEMHKREMPGQPLFTGRKVIPLLKLAIKEDVYPEIAQVSLDAFGVNTAPRAIPIPHSSESLTPREVETLQLLMTGATNQEIADRLVITKRTAKAHVSHILQKLQVSSRAAAVARAHELSLL